MFYNRGTLESPGIPTNTLCCLILVFFVHFLVELLLDIKVPCFPVATMVRLEHFHVHSRGKKHTLLQISDPL